MTIQSQTYPDGWQQGDDPLHDERQEQRRLAMEQEGRVVRINGQRYDPDDLPSRSEL